MRSLRSELRRRPVSLRVADPRRVHEVYALLRSLGIASLVRLAGEGVEVPGSVLAARRRDAVLAAWIALCLEGGARPLLGVDLGLRNVGVAVLVGDVVAYTGVVRGLREVVELAADLLELGAGLRVRVGYTRSWRGMADALASKLGAMGAEVELVPEEEARREVVVGDFVGFTRKLSPHELDALRIALHPKRYINERGPR